MTDDFDKRLHESLLEAEKLKRAGKVLRADVRETIGDKYRASLGCRQGENLLACAVGELPITGWLRAKWHLMGCRLCRSDLRVLQAALRRDVMPAPQSSGIREMAHAVAQFLQGPIGSGATALLALSAFVLSMWVRVPPQGNGSISPPEGPDLVAKGADAVSVTPSVIAVLAAALALVFGSLVLARLLRRPTTPDGDGSGDPAGSRNLLARRRSMRRRVLVFVTSAAMLAAVVALVLLLVRPSPPPPLPLPPPGERCIALIVGIPSYSDPRLCPLPGAVNDASSLAHLWRAAGYQVVLAPPAASREEILRLLFGLASSNRVGRFTLAWSGHGAAYRGTSYFLPADARLDDVAATGITLDQIRQVIEKAKANFSSFRLLADVCRVGADKISAGFAEALSKSADNWTLITSCAAGQVSAEIRNLRHPAWQAPESKEPHGLFIYSLLVSRYGWMQGGQVYAQADANRDGKISWHEALAFAETNLQVLGSLYSRGPGASTTNIQRPQMSGHFSATSSEDVFCLVEAIQEKRNPEKIEPDQILFPQVDASNRFVLYSDMKDDTIFTFVPYGWFCTNWLGKALSPEAWAQMMLFDVNCVNHPYGDQGSCISWTLQWEGRTTNGEPWRVPWAGVGWISGPDLPAWWAENGDNRGRYYNLERPRKFKSLKFKAYSLDEGTVLTVKLGILSEDAAHNKLILGDSLAAPIEKRFHLTDRWVEYELPLEYTAALRHQFSPEGHSCVGATRVCGICGNNPSNPKTVANMLERICSFAFVFEKVHQQNTNSTARVFIDDIYFAALPQQ